MGVILNLLAAPAALRTLRAARALLENETPLKGDCGRLCGHACCQSDETGENGMLLYPFEDRFYRKPIEGFPFTLKPDDTLVKGGWRLVCEGVCPREHRPLACRVFPLRVRLIANEADGTTEAKAELDPRAWAVCPLLEEGGLRAMGASFIHAVEAAGELLAANTFMLEMMLAEQCMVDEMRRL